MVCCFYTHTMSVKVNIVIMSDLLNRENIIPPLQGAVITCEKLPFVDSTNGISADLQY